MRFSPWLLLRCCCLVCAVTSSEVPRSFELVLTPNADGENNHVSCRLFVEFPATYPEVCAMVRVRNEKGLLERHMEELSVIISARVFQAKGEVAVYLVAEAVKEFLVEHNQPVLSMHEQMEARSSAKVSEEEEYLAKRRALEARIEEKKKQPSPLGIEPGTLLTPESFARWRALFDAEQKLIREAKEAAKPRMERLTGKQLFQQNLARDLGEDEADKLDEEPPPEKNVFCFNEGLFTGEEDIDAGEDGEEQDHGEDDEDDDQDDDDEVASMFDTTTNAEKQLKAASISASSSSSSSSSSSAAPVAAPAAAPKKVASASSSSSSSSSSAAPASAKPAAAPAAKPAASASASSASSSKPAAAAPAAAAAAPASARPGGRAPPGFAGAPAAAAASSSSSSAAPAAAAAPAGKPNQGQQQQQKGQQQSGGSKQSDKPQQGKPQQGKGSQAPPKGGDKKKPAGGGGGKK